ncbi:hypothetical protein, partial [Methyloceanibacter sp.]|uniref:hypothetical protein n=1 Tax=Methyloceanibacter sp. TaxID=1965321 RepID=UPI003D6D6DAF
MSTAETFATSDVNWFVGASYGGKDDRTSQFLAEGVWVNGYDNKYLDLVRSMRPGERIAIKSTYTRKRGLPFDNKEQPISVMAIKAIGTVTENLNDGRHVRVDWTKLDPVHEWYFYTHRATVWRVRPGEWMADGLIAFTFEGKPQDINRFRSTPYWQDRIDFKWTSFYENVADKLLPFRENRSPLVEALRKASSRMEGLGYLTEDQYADGTTGFVRDICPFTTIGTFNRGLKDFNRKAIASELAEFLGVEEPIPASFEGIPLLNNMKSWFFPYEAERSADHIQALWDVFAASLVWSENDGDEERAAFANAFDNANGRPRVAWNLTMGLYWIRPWSFLSLDKNSRSYITEKLGVPIGRHGPKKLCNSADYLEVMDTLYARFQEDSYPVASYPEVSLESWHYAEPKQNAAKEEDESEDEMVDEFDDL